MTQQQIDAVTAWRSSPLTSKTMWSLYVGQFTLALLAWQIVAVMRDATPTSVLLALIAATGAVSITGVAGTSLAESIVRLLLARGPTVQAEYAGKRQSSPPGGGQ